MHLTLVPSPPHPPFEHLLLEEKGKGNGICFEGGRALFFYFNFVIKHFIIFLFIIKHSSTLSLN